jgi:4-amino-4-deoxy-L-arabinose transferase-like glycosyltransferase
MTSEQIQERRFLALSSPTLAVLAAYAIRMLVLWLSQQNAGGLTLPITGLEEGLVALSLAKGKGFFGPFPTYQAPTAWLAPGYPFLWSLLIRLTRCSPAPTILLAQTLNCAFSAATCWPIFSIGKKLFGETVGLAASWIWVFLPFSILMSLEWTWDQCVAAFLLALAVEATLRLGESMSTLKWTGFGLLWAAAALVNPATGSMLPFLLAWLVFRRWKMGIRSPALYARVVLMFFLAILPWSIRNYYALDGWVFVKSNFGVALYVGNHPDSLKIDPHPMDSFSEVARLIFEGEPKFSNEEQHLAMDYIKTHPTEFIKKTWNRILDTWSAKDDSEADGWIGALHLQREDVWLCSSFSVLALAGLILALQENWIECLPLALCLLFFPLPYYISLAEMRYRHPIDPFMTIFAAYAVARLWGALNPRSTFQKLHASTTS